ncbi:NADH-quinone oxidoreductase subunit A [soil metagenome]|nr:NADH-quinone oxidoreductase subunit A [Deinococcota bacterium]
MQPYALELTGALYIALFTLVGVLIVFVTLGISRLIAPRNLTPGKLAIYECGETPIGGTDVQFNVNYYLFAIMFVIFDVEVAFFFPWAVAFGALGWYGVVGVLLFLLVLLDGLVYAWQRGVLKWVY